MKKEKEGAKTANGVIDDAILVDADDAFDLAEISKVTGIPVERLKRLTKVELRSLR